MTEYAGVSRAVALSALVCSLISCSKEPEGTGDLGPSGGTAGNAGSGGMALGGSGGSGGSGGTSGTTTNAGNAGAVISLGGQGQCVPKTCAELGWACGSRVNECGGVTNCADEGLSCANGEACVGGLDSPTTCVAGLGSCEVCENIPDCTASSEVTKLRGRVVTPGRTDAESANQVGVPNAVVYIMRSTDLAELPPINSGIPEGGTSCDRCEDQDLGPVLVGTVTDATGRFELEGAIPVGAEFLLVVKAGKFRRVVRHSLPMSAACQATELPTALPDNPARLPRALDDGLAVNIPMIAVSTGQLDAMECVFAKMGVAQSIFNNPGTASSRVHLYRGGPNTGMPPGSGARIDDATPHASSLYGDLARLQSYDLVIADCEGQSWDGQFTERDASGGRVREYVNRGGRLFASHLSFSWLHQNGMAEYSAADPIATGLGLAATWTTSLDTTSMTGTGVISLGRPNASPRIQSFADWMAGEAIVTPPANTFSIREPRSQATGLGAASEEFVYREGMNGRVQQFSFNTPYGAPADAVCGRVAYSGFHVSVTSGGDNSRVIFPAHCSGDLTAQEKVLLYMLFDLGACIGEPPPPPDCTPSSCEDVNVQCGMIGDGCGNVLNCGACPPPR